MKFAHMSDCHIGGWREPKLRDLNSKAFQMAIDHCLSEKVDFVIIAGDLFNTAVPGIDSLSMATKQLKRLKDADIPMYFIAGSHDFSPSGKTMLDVIEHAGLGKNLARGEELADNKLKLNFTVDAKTGVKLVGLIGKKGGLEKEYYYHLAREPLEKESGFKIFVFHSAVTEMKPKGMEQMESLPVSLLPEGFEYYAAGHVHVVDNVSLSGRKNIVFPGPCFPNNFSEVEKLRHGSFMLFDNGVVTKVPLSVAPVVCLSVDADGKSVSEVEALVRKEIASQDVKGAVVTIRVAGCISKGKPADIQWNDLLHDAYARGAHFVMRNANALTSKELEVVMVKESQVEDVEDAVLRQHAGQFKLKDEDVALAKKLMSVLAADKADGEKLADFETRISSEMDKLFE